MNSKKANSDIPTSTLQGWAGREQQRHIKEGLGKSVISQDQMEMLRTQNKSFADVFCLTAKNWRSCLLTE